jgi:ubiquinone biosynthesis protein COQ4
MTHSLGSAATNGPIAQRDYTDHYPLQPRSVQWRRFAKAMCSLIAQKGDTLNAVFTVADALGGMGEERLFQKFRKDPIGQQLLAERPNLPELLSDVDRLIAMPEGSFGRIFGDLCRRTGIRALDQVESQRHMSRDFAQLDPARQWFFDRVAVVHDLWHVLTGYETQNRGEAAMVAFSYAQGVDSRPVRVFIVSSALTGVARAGELWRAFRRGRRTPLLIAQRYEDLLPLPLDTVRARLKLPDGRSAHGAKPREGLLVEYC